jgi:MFS family permease
MLKAWRDLAQLPRNLWILAAASLVNRMGTMAFPFLALYLTQDLGFSATEAGLVLGFYGSVALLVGPLAGRLSDRLGPVPVMEASLALSGGVLLLFPLARGWPSILAMTALFAATLETFRPASLSTISGMVPPESRKQAYALIRLAINLGMSIGPTLGGFLAQRSFPAVFLVDGLTSIAAAGLLLLSPFHSLRLELRGSPAPPPGLPWARRLFGEAWRDRRFAFFLLASIPVGLVFFQHASTLPLYMVRDLGLDSVSFGLVMTVNTTLILLFELPLNSATSRWGHRLTLAAGSALFAIGFGAVALAGGAWGIAATVAIWTVGEMILFPGMSAYVGDLAPEARRGEYMGLWTMSFSLSFMLGPWLGTLALERLGGNGVWPLMLAAGLVSTALLSRVAEPGSART